MASQTFQLSLASAAMCVIACCSSPTPQTRAAQGREFLLTGKVSFDGAAPQSRPIPRGPTFPMVVEPECAQSSNTPEEVLVNDGGLENVIVFVSSSVSGSFSSPNKPVVLDQQNCRFQPHVLTIQVGQPLTVRNSDKISHSVHALSEVSNNNFNLNMPPAGMEFVRRFGTAEVAVLIKDDIHPWKRAWAGVFAHPFHTVTGKGGRFQLRLPPGNYEITAWHEKRGSVKQSVRIEDRDASMGFTFKQQ